MKRIKSLLLPLILFAISLQAQAPLKDTDILKNWHHKNFSTTDIYGISTEKAHNFLKKRKRKPKPIIVTVIDTGIDIHHEDLKNNIWTNPKEIPDNGIDDDNNGYIDDIHGWNFIGGKETEITYDTAEITRVIKKFKPLFDNGDRVKDKEMQELLPNDYKMYLKAKEEYEKKLIESKKNQTKAQHFERLKTALIKGCNEVSRQLGNKKLIPEVISSIRENSEESTFLKNVLQQTSVSKKHEIDEQNIEEIKKNIEADLNELINELTKEIKYLYNIDFNPRNIVGDRYEDIQERYYGNNRVNTSHSLHGTHVAGIIAAVRNNNIGIDGITDHVKIMPVRAVPDGDERDKDIANAIRYAVDNGAKIINMSFGKSLSPEKSAVDEAVKYAQEQGVLIIKAAGNESKNIDEYKYYPNNRDTQGNVINKLWITVGASNYESDQKLLADFSNYGKENVDIFAPGVDIYSTAPDNSYRFLSGTSMASPMVAGGAALLWSHYPKLNAAQVKDLLLRSTNVVKETVNLRVEKKENSTKTEKTIKFNELSKTGGILNIYKAMQLAEKEYVSK